jgi:dihydropteroate synthase
MGILNITPDSFSDGGDFLETDKAVSHALKLQDQGADIIDIGGESSRPGADRISPQEEIDRVMPAIERLVNILEIPISIDTCRAQVAEVALDAGVHMINDISALRSDSGVGELAVKYNVPVVLMHMKGQPKTMQANPAYDDVVDEIIQFFDERLQWIAAAGISREKIIIDPGIGFGKRVEDNYEILRRLSEFRKLELPILVGPSRKSFIGAVTNLPPQDRLEGTLAAVTACVLNGAHIVRVHDVLQTRQAVQVADCITGKVVIK